MKDRIACREIMKMPVSIAMSIQQGQDLAPDILKSKEVKRLLAEALYTTSERRMAQEIELEDALFYYRLVTSCLAVEQSADIEKITDKIRM